MHNKPLDNITTQDVADIVVEVNQRWNEQEKQQKILDGNQIVADEQNERKAATLQRIQDRMEATQVEANAELIRNRSTRRIMRIVFVMTIFGGIIWIIGASL